MSQMLRVRLLAGVLGPNREHLAEGTVHRLPLVLASALIGSRRAVLAEEPAADAETPAEAPVRDSAPTGKRR